MRVIDMVIDTDVHHLYAEEADLLEYLPVGYAERFEEYGQPLVGVRGLGNTVGFDEFDASTRAASAGAVMADVSPQSVVQRRLLDEHGVDASLLLGSPPFWAPNSMPNKDYANVLCSAYNDYTLDRWLDEDDRFHASITVNHQDPAAAAAEIERVGDHEQVVAVNLTPRADRPFGNKQYDPIYEAAVDQDLAVTIHPGYDGAGIHGDPPTSAGYPTTAVEKRLVRHTLAQSHVTSLVLEGTFEKFPKLRVACLGWGWSWLSGYFWRLDTEWKNLRTEVPWVESDPTSYVKEHFRFGVQPGTDLESTPSLEKIFEWIDGEDLLMYGSDFPYETAADPASVLPSTDPAVRERVLSKNAAEFFRFA